MFNLTKEKKRNLFVCLIISFILALGISVAFQSLLAWTPPSATPPGSNVPEPLNVSDTGQSKGGNLILNANDVYTSGLIVAKGNVGIGTTSPDSKLEVAAGGVRINVTNRIVNHGGANYPSMFHVITSDSQAADKGATLSLGGATGGDPSYYTFATISGRKENSVAGNFAGYLQFSVDTADSTIVERMRIDSSGNVGIGTPNPSESLHVVGNIRLADSDPSGVDNRIIPKGQWFEFSSHGGSHFILDENDQSVGGDTDDFSVFAVDDTTIPLFRIQGAGLDKGNVGIGTMSPGYDLEVAGNIHATGNITCDGSCGGSGGYWTQNVSDIYYNTGNVGIGTMNPETKLHVASGNILLSNNQKLQWEASNGANTDIMYYDGNNRVNLSSGGNEFVFSDEVKMNDGIEILFGTAAVGTGDYAMGYNSADDTLRIVDGSDLTTTPRITLNNQGSVGIGTTNPQAKFEVEVPAGDNTKGIRIDMKDTSNLPALDIYIEPGHNGYGAIIDDDGSGIALYIDSESTTGNEALYARGHRAANFMQDTGGGAGGYGLKVSRNIAEAGVYPLVDFLDSNTLNTKTTLKITQYGTGDIINLFDGTTEVFTVTDGGNVGIGTMSPLMDLHVYDSGASTDIRIHADSDQMAALYFGENTGTAVYAPGNSDDLRFYVGSNDRMSITSGGNVGIGDTDPAYRLEVGGGDINTTTGGYRDSGACVAGTCASDIRLKKNIQKLSDGSLDKILQLSPSTFEFIDEQYGSLDINYGLVAQEVENIFPEWVITDEDGYKKIRYGLNIQMHILKAIQEIKEENNDLKQRIEALESK